MRKTLIDKCEEVINGEQWPGQAQDLRTGRIFKDLMNFYSTCEQSQFSAMMIGMHSIHNTTSPTAHGASPFIPQVSQKTLKQSNGDDISSTDYQSASAQNMPAKGYMNRKRS